MNPHLPDPADYPELVRTLLERPCAVDLGPGLPVHEITPHLSELHPEAIVGAAQIADRDAARCCLAGLWLRFHHLDHSHSLSQSIATIDGSYWHGLMHRREPDYPNAKYWFRRIGRHPIFAPLLTAARHIVDGLHQPEASLLRLVQAEHWDPFRFVDLCEAAYGTGRPTELACQLIADGEWLLLFEHCFRQARGDRGSAATP